MCRVGRLGFLGVEEICGAEFPHCIYRGPYCLATAEDHAYVSLCYYSPCDDLPDELN